MGAAVSLLCFKYPTTNKHTHTNTHTHTHTHTHKHTKKYKCSGINQVFQIFQKSKGADVYCHCLTFPVFLNFHFYLSFLFFIIFFLIIFLYMIYVFLYNI